MNEWIGIQGDRATTSHSEICICTRLNATQCQCRVPLETYMQSNLCEARILLHLIILWKAL